MTVIVLFPSLLFLFFSVLETESQVVNITSQPASPVRVLEGQPLTLQWTFSVTNTFLRVKFALSGSNLNLIEASPGSPSVIGKEFRGRVTASSTKTNATFTFSSMNRIDAASYVLVVLDTDNEFAIASLELIVLYPPSFETRAPDQVVLEGGPAINLTCTAVGEPEPNITWTKVFANGSDSDVLFTGEQYIFPNNRINEGTYRCNASSSIGNDVNHTVNVVVNFKPEITFRVKSSNESICRGDTINITCSAVGKPAVHTYQLFKDGTQVHTSNNATLFWRQETTIGGETVYTCVANNTVAVANTTKAITVGVPSSIQSILDKVVTEGDNVTLTCNASGIPTQVSWINVRSGNRTYKNVLELKNISRHEAGEYRCDVRNPCRNATESATIEVQFKPEMVQLVTSERTICQGDIISLNCTANSNPAIHTYQLYVNGTMVNEASSTGVWNRTMTTGGVFVYKCMVNNTVGTATSMDVFVTVNVPSSIQSIPDKVVTEGDSVTLICNASGIPTQVSWINVRRGNRTHGNVLEIENVSRHEAGEYRCEARNPCRNATESATIDVQFKPEMVQLVTRERTVCQGDIITFNCTANSNPAIHTYQLYMNGTMVNESSTGVWNRRVTAEGVVVYKCMVNNTIGTAMSMDVSVTVNVPSSIQSIPDKVVTEGNNVTLICNASGIPEPVVSWINVRSGNRTHRNVLEFENVNRHEAGEYRCEARNPCRNATENATIDVQYAPEITYISAPATLNGVETLTLNCTADGNPEPTITWTRLPNGIILNMPWTVTGKAHAGGYRCSASNIIGTVTKDTSITVNHAPEITHISAPHILSRPEMLTLNCTADGVPTPNITWTRLPNGETVDMPLTVTENKYATVYRCTASNEIGTVFKDTLVTRGYCEEACKGRWTCLVGLCGCPIGKTGDTCEKNDQPKKTVEVGLVFTMTFKAEYSDLQNPDTKKLILKIEVAVKVELSGTELTQVRVVSFKRGSVIADLELTFNSSTYEDYLRGRLQDATKDNKLGDLDVKQVVVGRFISTDEPEPVKCNQFFEGKDCKKASGALIALIVVAVIVVVAILIGIVACSLHKKNASGGGSFQTVKVSQRQDPEGNNSLARDYGEPGGSRETLHGNDNTGYDPERPPESTQMVTFNSNNGQMQGIHLPDSRSQET